MAARLIKSVYTNGLSGPIVKFKLAAPCSSQSFCEMNKCLFKSQYLFI